MAATRIAFCITELDAGGAERALTDLVLGLPRADWEPKVWGLGPWGPFASVLAEAGIPVRCLEGQHVWDAPRVLWRLRQELRTFQPQLLQTFLFHANVIGRCAGRWAGVPRIVSGLRVADRRSRLYGWCDRLTLGLVDRTVCVSHGVAQFAEEHFRFPAARNVVIPNSVDAQRFQQATPIPWDSLGIPNDVPILIAIGRLEPQKGIDDLLQALPRVFETHRTAHLVVVGDGPDRAALEWLVASPPLAGRVHFLGRRTDVPQLLAGATAFVLPSRWEGMPNVVLEAMAAGKPVVATMVEGTAELLTEGETGWRVPVGDREALADRLTALLAAPTEAAAVGLAAQASVRKSFTAEAMVARYVALYRDLLSSGR